MPLILADGCWEDFLYIHCLLFQALKALDNILLYGGWLMKACEVICHMSLGPQKRDLYHYLDLIRKKREKY